MATQLKTYMDLINECDNFPRDDPLKPRLEHWSTIYQFFLGDDSRPHGFMLPETVKKMPWTDCFYIDHNSRTVHLQPANASDAETFTAALSAQVQRCIDQDTFRVIHQKHSEPYPIIGAASPVSIERFASTLFGIISRGAHLTVYTMTAEGMKIWVPRRSPNLFTYPNRLDTTVAGGVAAGEGPWECMVREAGEEASLPDVLVRKDAKACGCISYIGLNNAAGGGETGLINSDIVYVFDLELEEGVECRKNDEEVKEFYLMSVEEVKAALARGEFKTNSALVMIDFFVRHGIITPENEANYAEIVARLHRRLLLATTPGQ